MVLFINYSGVIGRWVVETTQGATGSLYLTFGLLLLMFVVVDVDW